MKTKSILFAAMLIAFSACKKGDNTSKDSFDPTQYYVSGTSGSGNYAYAITISTGGKGIWCSAIKKFEEPLNWQYNNSMLRFSAGSGDSINFTINNKAVVRGVFTGRYETIGKISHPFSLQRIPATDAFAEKTFSTSEGGAPVTVKFDNNKNYTMTYTGNMGYTVKGTYSLLNKGVAKSASISPGYEAGYLFVMMDGKLFIAYDSDL